MIRVIRRDHSQPDCLSVSFGYTTDQFVLGVPLGSPKTSYVPSGSHVALVRERASSWFVLHFKDQAVTRFVEHQMLSTWKEFRKFSNPREAHAYPPYRLKQSKPTRLLSETTLQPQYRVQVVPTMTT
uniref:CACTA en-spm transposon protein n=1 Tax=Cucumis melo TaxID=3656 RepID=A0A9I9E586_CUCME